MLWEKLTWRSFENGVLRRRSILVVQGGVGGGAVGCVKLCIEESHSTNWVWILAA